jgi:hypothetical protein
MRRAGELWVGRFHKEKTWMGYTRYGLMQRFFQLKLLLITLVVINAYFFVVPAITSATELAVRSLAQGRLLPEYRAAYRQESIRGMRSWEHAPN